MEHTEVNKKIEYLKGDRVLWITVILISVFSILPVYSASSNLEYIVNTGTTTSHLIKHVMFIALGLFLMRVIGAIKYEFIGKLSSILLVISVILLGVTIFTGQTIDGASASRWLKIPGTAISFQPSALAALMLVIYLCRYLTKNIQRQRLPIENIMYVFGPILLVFILVAKDNGSTALMILATSLIVLVIGQFPWKYIAGFVSLSGLASIIFILVALNTNLMPNNRVHTWISRVESFSSSKDAQLDSAERDAVKAKNYQVMHAKAAIVHGGITGKGPGKSALKQRLPQSASDFIFAIIVEEYGVIGAVGLLGMYFIIIIRILIIASRTRAFFGSLLVISLGIMIFIQLSANIMVALNLIPVTGQPLPLISYGGTSMLVTYAQLGLILNISSRIQIYDEEGIGKKQNIEEINDIA
ncbi:FtsW/RodA/SpoVE family cell cycle protein [Riemerella anatipestifer]|uniref:Probable peptidoglycan glycosyltransferase FtsW n=1 Tax=Riemerella anatipestifer TaxID=34085 RepID=A0A1S7DS60_RIEAN|nr:FtsW/RodA/SpoVE family cell cycle protein [Riemerella anatipestifer]AQY21881.1 Lipid II flippase FtsW [Riemerella anatipestifer]MCO4304623.1 FtsW/RodA/SpoVE family cell cycle protein [Riemerella anatipestifer]MCO7353424.1 FtsW/RodA/SpoVE family cell cycle protein [Riemerella anatipestifer]MCQ4039930.1 FtsW/RodA/SpoVE family cell cycle protein [Riemerella anatipestifer]MCT6761599.1 FtsW/RodA/SpoVE family cell cycle protein [Riemerella anatipestifer]